MLFLPLSSHGTLYHPVYVGRGLTNLLRDGQKVTEFDALCTTSVSSLVATI